MSYIRQPIYVIREAPSHDYICEGDHFALRFDGKPLFPWAWNIAEATPLKIGFRAKSLAEMEAHVWLHLERAIIDVENICHAVREMRRELDQGGGPGPGPGGAPGL